MKQTAVDWLIDMLVTENEVTLKGENYKLFEIAKQMEKEQMMEYYEEGYNRAAKLIEDAAKQNGLNLNII
jgi:hypothetical protein